MKNLTLSDQLFQRFHCQKKDIRNAAEFSSTAQLKLSFRFLENILRHPVAIAISLIENKFSSHFQ